MNELKVYEKLTVVKLKDWTQITTTIDLENLYKALSSWITFVKLWWMIVNTSTIVSAEERKWSWIDDFVLSFDREIQQRLRWIIKKRNESWFKVNVEVLRNAYKTTYWEDL